MTLDMTLDLVTSLFLNILATARMLLFRAKEFGVLAGTASAETHSG